MTKYIAHLYTEADWAETEIKAATPAQALERAREIEADRLEILDFQSYGGAGDGVEHIRIIRASDGETVAEWKSKTLTLRLAASDVLDALEAQTDAAQAVIDAWAKGDLAGAVRMLDGSISSARAAIAKAKGA